MKMRRRIADGFLLLRQGMDRRRGKMEVRSPLDQGWWGVHHQSGRVPKPAQGRASCVASLRRARPAR